MSPQQDKFSRSQYYIQKLLFKIKEHQKQGENHNGGGEERKKQRKNIYKASRMTKKKKSSNSL